MNQSKEDFTPTFIKARQLLTTKQRDAAWCTAVEEVVEAVGQHITTANEEIDHSSDPIVRQIDTTLIGELITIRQQLERALEAEHGKSPSLIKSLKHTLGLDSQKSEPASEQ